MTKEKLVSLKRYLDDLTIRLTSSIPEKHKNHSLQYIKYLQREINAVNSKIESAKLESLTQPSIK